MNRNCVGNFLMGTENGDKVMGINILFLLIFATLNKISSFVTIRR
jgi:hypothetical protein